MFKRINNILININNITKIEYLGIDPKDEKNYCKITIIGEDIIGILIEGTLEEVQNFLTK